jgi:DNA-binding CsgD family transcriptional regulator
MLVGDRADRELGVRLHRLQGAAHGSHALVDIRRTRADAPLWLHLCALQPDAALGTFGERAMVVATLFDPAQVVALDPFALAEVFALTPTEAKVAARLAEGATAQTIAAEQGTTVYTVRAHVRSLLVKFGVHRTTDVVRMLCQGESLWARAGDASAALN